MAATAEIRPLLSEATSLPAVLAFADSEFDLLIACCADSSTDRMCQILSQPLDWERMMRLVDHHRVVPQVYAALSPLSRQIPAQPLDALCLRYQDNARNALWFTGELLRILNHLESAGIKAVPYKGPVLAKILYGEVTARQFRDLDILILPEDVPKAKAALLDLGYKTRLDLAPSLETDYIKTGYEYSFSLACHSNLLELQWRIVPRFYSVDFDVADLFERADEISLGSRGGMQYGFDRRVQTLCAEDLLLVLCVHAAKHVWVQLSWLCDIAHLTKSMQLDWTMIQDEAQRLGIERIVSLNLLLAHKLLGSAMPHAIPPYCHSERSEESAVAANHKNADECQAIRHLSSRAPASGARNLQSPPGEDPARAPLTDEILHIIQRSTHYDTESLPYFRLMLRLRERWQDRACLLWRLAFTPSISEWSAVQLPKPLQPLYRLVRLSRLAKRLASAE